MSPFSFSFAQSIDEAMSRLIDYHLRVPLPDPCQCIPYANHSGGSAKQKLHENLEHHACPLNPAVPSESPRRTSVV
jgi:hypothetical protein